MGRYIEYNGTGAQTAVAGTYTTLKINNTTGVTLAGASAITALTIADVTANSIFNDGGFVISTATTLNLNSGTYICAATGVTAFPWGTANVSSGIVDYHVNSAQTVKGGITYGTLKINNTTGATLGAASTVTTLTIGDATANSIFNDGGFIVTPGASSVLNLTSGTYNLGSATVGTSWPSWVTRNITAGTTVGYISTVAQAVSTVPSYQNLTFSGVATKTPIAGTLTIGGDWSVSSPTALNSNNNIVNVTGNITGTGTITQGTGLITVSGDWTNTGLFAASTAGVTMNGAGHQITGVTGLTFTTLTINSPGTITNNNPGILTVSTALSGTGTLIQGINSTLKIGGTSGITSINATTNIPILSIIPGLDDSLFRQL